MGPSKLNVFLIPSALLSFTMESFKRCSSLAKHSVGSCYGLWFPVAVVINYFTFHVALCLFATKLFFSLFTGRQQFVCRCLVLGSRDFHRTVCSLLIRGAYYSVLKGLSLSLCVYVCAISSPIINRKGFLNFCFDWGLSRVHCFLTLNCLNFVFRSFLRCNPRWAPIVYRLIGAVLIWIFFIIPS